MAVETIKPNGISAFAIAKAILRDAMPTKYFS